MSNSPPPISPLDQTRPATQKGPTAYRLPEAATATFEHYFLNVAQNVRKPQIDEWVKEYGLKVESIRQWFQRRRVKALKSQTTATRSAPNSVAPNIPNLAPLAQDDDEDEQAAKQGSWFELEPGVPVLTPCNADFSYLVEEKILRLLAYFKDRRLNPRHVNELAEQLGVPAPVVIEFAKWKALREVAHLGNETGISHNNSVSPTRSTPTVAQTRSPSVLSVKMEVDEGAASLPTPQPSVGLSPSPSRTQSIEPDPTYVSFYDTWLNARATPLETSAASAGESPASILQKHLPPSIAQFAFGSSNAA